MTEVTAKYFSEEEWCNQNAPGINTSPREVRERIEREIQERMLQRIREDERQRQEMLPILNDATQKAMDADRERWEQEKPKVEAEAARTAQILFARNMKKLKKL